MPAAVTYTTVLGQVLMENRGGIVTEFVPDPLGSVVKHKDSSGAYVHSAEYWPYGEIQTSTGNLPGPFAFCGTWGYYRDNASQTYVRARYYKPVQGRWMTVDPLWPSETSYLYCGAAPTIFVDKLGTFKIIGDCTSTGKANSSAACKLLEGIDAAKLKKCMSPYPNPNGVLSCMKNKCQSSSICVICPQVNNGIPKLINPVPGWPSQCFFTCDVTFVVLPKPEPPVGKTDCKPANMNDPCAKAIKAAFPGCSCVIGWCDTVGVPGAPPRNSSEARLALLHELAHCCSGLAHGYGQGQQKDDFINRLECCLCLQKYSHAHCKRIKSCLK